MFYCVVGNSWTTALRFNIFFNQVLNWLKTLNFYDINLLTIVHVLKASYYSKHYSTSLSIVVLMCFFFWFVGNLRNCFSILKVYFFFTSVGPLFFWLFSVFLFITLIVCCVPSLPKKKQFILGLIITHTHLAISIILLVGYFYFTNFIHLKKVVINELRGNEHNKVEFVRHVFKLDNLKECKK